MKKQQHRVSPMKQLLDQFFSKSEKNQLKREKKKSKLFHLKVAEKPSKGKLFKERYGFSKNMKNNMVKAGVFDSSNTQLSLQRYRAIKKEERKRLATIQKEKHHQSLVVRKTKQSKSTTTKKAA